MDYCGPVMLYVLWTSGFMIAFECLRLVIMNIILYVLPTGADKGQITRKIVEIQSNHITETVRKA